VEKQDILQMSVSSAKLVKGLVMRHTRKFGYVIIAKRNLTKKANACTMKKNVLQNIAMTLIVCLVIDAVEKGTILPLATQQNILKAIT
jgi:hypothetical protein